MTAGIILAGGQSRRMNQDKRRLRLWGADGPTLLEHTLAVLTPLCDELIVVLNDPHAWYHLQATLVTDIVPGSGPAGGLYTGLLYTHAPSALVVAADMPFLNPRLLRYMLSYPQSYDALVPIHPHNTPQMNTDTPRCCISEKSGSPSIEQVEPLHAVYSRACLPHMQAALDEGIRRMADILARLDTVYLSPEEVARHDSSGMSFTNINTREDWYNTYHTTYPFERKGYERKGMDKEPA